MSRKTVAGIIVTTFLLVHVGHAQAQEGLQTYFSEVASQVKAMDDPAEKRELTAKSLRTMAEAVDRVQRSRMISKEDRARLEQLKVTVQDKQDELAGLNGFQRVPDGQLNAFVDYVVQDMEQAERTITISLVAALLIIIILILLV
jgi:cell division protein FtsX